MTSRRVNAAVCGFVVLSAGVAGNVIFLQRGSALNGGFGGHNSEPIGGAADASPSPRSGVTVGDAERIAEDASAFTATRRVDVVQAVQRELGRRGYNPGIPNGVVNVATRGAIMAYQRDHGLPLSGEASEALLKAIVFEISGAGRARGNSISADQANPKAPIIRTAQ